jgi:dienelactone hydrolase
VEARENPSWLAAMMINLNGFDLETQSIPRNFGLGSASCVVSFEPMSVLYLALGLIAVYAAIVMAMYVGQTWLLFPTALARMARVQLPSSTQHLEVRTPDGESLKGIRTPSLEEAAQNAPTLLGFGGNAWNAKATALTLHRLFPDRDIVASHYRGYAPSNGRPSAEALMSDSLAIFDSLREVQIEEPIVAVGFSIGSGVAAYLARHRPVAGLVLVTPFDSLEALALDLYWWAPVGLLFRHRMRTIEFVRGSLAPTALITAERDKVVPARRSAPLRAAIKNLVFERDIDSGHNNIYDHPAFATAMREALTRIEAARAEALGRQE